MPGGALGPQAEGITFPRASRPEPPNWDGSSFEKFSFVGELALDGGVRPVKGVLPVALEARRQEKEAIFVPATNAHEAAMVEGITVYGVHNLRETFEFIRGESLIAPTYGDLTSFFATHKNYEVDFSDVKGQGHVKRAIEVAVAGGHNLLMLCNNYLKTSLGFGGRSRGLRWLLYSILDGGKKNLPVLGSHCAHRQLFILQGSP
jgi:magnesium chelatase family protein